MSKAANIKKIDNYKSNLDYELNESDTILLVTAITADKLGVSHDAKSIQKLKRIVMDAITYNCVLESIEEQVDFLLAD